MLSAASGVRKGVEGWERKSLEAQASFVCCRAWNGIFFAGNAYPNACIPAMQPAVCELCASNSIITTIRSIYSTYSIIPSCELMLGLSLW